MTLIATTETVVPDERLLEAALCERALHQLARHALDPADLRELGLALGLLTSSRPCRPRGQGWVRVSRSPSGWTRI
jgi:hypothetical protein